MWFSKNKSLKEELARTKESNKVLQSRVNYLETEIKIMYKKYEKQSEQFEERIKSFINISQ